MTSLLIVNGDEAQSPMLPPMGEKLSVLGEVRVAVPDNKQSWKGFAAYEGRICQLVK